MTNTFTSIAKSAAGIAARLTAAAIMSTLVLGSAVVPAKAATATDTITVPAAVHRGQDLAARLNRTAMVNRLTCRTLSGFAAGAVPPPRSCDHAAATESTRLAAGEALRPRF
jgi:hypothetical protein